MAGTTNYVHLFCRCHILPIHCDYVSYSLKNYPNIVDPSSVGNRRVSAANKVKGVRAIKLEGTKGMKGKNGYVDDDSGVMLEL